MTLRVRLLKNPYARRVGSRTHVHARALRSRARLSARPREHVRVAYVLARARSPRSREGTRVAGTLARAQGRFYGNLRRRSQSDSGRFGLIYFVIRPHRGLRAGLPSVAGPMDPSIPELLDLLTNKSAPESFGSLI